MTKKQWQSLGASYARSFGAAFLAAVIAVGDGKIPFDFTADDWKAVLNALWIALIPVAQRYFSEGDKAFGRGAS